MRQIWASPDVPDAASVEAVCSIPDLFGVAQLDVSTLFNKLRISLQEVDPPACVFLQIIKLILEQQTYVSVTSDMHENYRTINSRWCALSLASQAADINKETNTC